MVISSTERRFYESTKKQLHQIYKALTINTKKTKKWRVKLDFDFPNPNCGRTQKELMEMLNNILINVHLRSIQELKDAEITKLSLQIVLNDHYENHN